MAQREARKASVRLDDEWAALRAQTPNPAKTAKEWPADYDVIEAAGKLYPVPPPPGGWPKPEPDGMTAAEYEQAEYEYELEFEEEKRLHPDYWHEDAPSEWERLPSFLRAALEAKGITPGTTTTPKAGQAPTTIPPQEAKRTKLDTLVEHWKRERRVNSKTIAKMERAILEFNLFHKDPAVEDITRSMVIAYRSDLLRRIKPNGDRALSKGTIDDRLSSIGTLLGLAFDHGIVHHNVAAKAALPADKLATKPRIGYTTEQAEKVMAGTKQYREINPARYWLPRLARWTGARLNELHQLRRQDIAEREGILGINIIDEGEHAEGIPMRMKNAASRRWVPLHPALAEFWAWAKERPAGALFPATPDKHGTTVSSEFSKWYGRTLRGKWGIKDDRVTFHSWRHMFADACRSAGVQDSVRHALMGHAEGGAAGGYGSGALPPAVLAEAIRKIR